MDLLEPMLKRREPKWDGMYSTEIKGPLFHQRHRCSSIHSSGVKTNFNSSEITHFKRLMSRSCHAWFKLCYVQVICRKSTNLSVANQACIRLEIWSFLRKSWGSLTITFSQTQKKFVQEQLSTFRWFRFWVLHIFANLKFPDLFIPRD